MHLGWACTNSPLATVTILLSVIDGLPVVLRFYGLSVRLTIRENAK